ncbi:MAG: hypothetical protein GVY23_04335 [Spirochaetes bacterium]|jgi:isocitrate dehydrogenase kinase/phosphatase|nr:hypothetical protein [Spirochaetota bacterium]
MGVTDEVVSAFEEVHVDLFTADFWNDVKSRIKEGSLLPILP